MFIKSWMNSIEAQLIEGGSGDIIVLAGKDKNGGKMPTRITAPVRFDRDGEPVWSPQGDRWSFPPPEKPASRINWRDRAPNWKDVKGFHGAKDIENPVGEWNRLDTLDLLLIHWPSPRIPLEETMRAFEHLVSTGKVRNIGISNFIRCRVDEAIASTSLPIAVNQVEYHPHLKQEKLFEHCMERGVLVTAYCPIAQGAVLQDETLKSIARNHDKTPVQVTLRWLIQNRLLPSYTNPPLLGTR